MSSSGKRIRDRRHKDALLISKKNLVPLLIAGVGLIALVVAGVVLLAGGGGGGGTPQVLVEQDTFDYGDVLMNTPITTVFVVKNVGDGVLKIAGIPEVVVKEGC